MNSSSVQELPLWVKELSLRVKTRRMCTVISGTLGKSITIWKQLTIYYLFWFSNDWWSGWEVSRMELVKMGWTKGIVIYFLHGGGGGGGVVDHKIIRKFSWYKGEQQEENTRKCCLQRGPVNLIKWVKIAHSFLQSVSNQFHIIILSLPMWFCKWMSKNFSKPTSENRDTRRFNF